MQQDSVMPTPYEMTVDLNVLEHLGINLYSNIAAVLTEAVANAWDADATAVDIRVDEANNVITIQDDGIGMTVADMNEKYLRVGYRRREEDPTHGKMTAKGRSVMGRKRLGKLSLFSIAEIIEVQSAKDGQIHGLRMTVDGIHESVQQRAAVHHPEPLPDGEIIVTQGTLIRLKQIKRQRLGRGVKTLRIRLARRFSIIGASQGFTIKINDDPVTVDERGDLSACQFLWHFGPDVSEGGTKPQILEREQLPQRLDHWNSQWLIKGWVGTASRPKQLDSDDAGNLNSIVVFARGRLFHENILDRLNDGRLYTKYLTHQIEAGFLDSDTYPDIATSDRQRVQEDDPRYIQLLNFLKTQTTQIEKRWTEWRRKHEVKKAKETIPALAMWLDGLPPGYRESAEELVSQIGSLPLEKDEDVKSLYKHGIMAFERMKLRGSTEALVASIGNIDRSLKLLADRGLLEASLYRDIVKSRVDAIREFQKLVDDDAKEKVLQKYLFDHLWLLDPSWKRATGSEIMETRLTDEGVIVADLTEKEKLGRVDIKYRSMAGKHIIVELKRVDRQMKLLELQEQGQTYVDKLKKILLSQNEPTPNIEVVFVIGKPIAEEASNPERLKSSMAAVSPGSRIISLRHADQRCPRGIRGVPGTQQGTRQTGKDCGDAMNEAATETPPSAWLLRATSLEAAPLFSQFLAIPQSLLRGVQSGARFVSSHPTAPKPSASPASFAPVPSREEPASTSMAIRRFDRNGL